MAKQTRTANKQARKLAAIEANFTSNLEATYTRLGVLLGNALENAQAIEIVDVGLARQQIETMLNDSGYFVEVETLLNQGYQEAIDESFALYKDLLGKEFQFSELSLQQINSIKQLDFENFRQISDRAVDALSREMVNLGFGATNITQAIEAVTGTMTQNLGWAKTWVTTGLQSIYNTGNVLLAEDNGIDKFIYIGPSDSLTRPFCRQHLGQTRTIDEWNALDNNQITPVSVYRGGYSCRHQLIGVA